MTREAPVPQQPREIVSLTALRGWLAVWVVMYHYWNDVLQLFPAARLASPVAQSGYMAVPAFFMLSGFVLTYNYADRLRSFSISQTRWFLAARLVRIYPVHLATLLAVAVMVWVSHRVGFRLTDAGYTARTFLLNLFLVHTWVPDYSLSWNYPSWSISSEWFAYLLFPFAAAFGIRRLTTPARAMAFGAAALLGSIGVLLYWRPWPFHELILVVPTFFAGAAVCRLGRRPPSASQAGARWVADLIAVAVPACCFVRPPDAAHALLVCLFLGLIAALAQVRGDRHPLWTSRPAVFVGEVSYSLYMSHTLAQKILYKLLPVARFEDGGIPVKVGILALYAGLITVSCLATYYLVEWPCREWFRRLRGRKGASQPPSLPGCRVTPDRSRSQNGDVAQPACPSAGAPEPSVASAPPIV